MRAYLCRLINNKELVGIFVCELSGLPWLVDECTDAHLCEYIPMPDGGLYWSSKAPAVPIPTDPESGEDIGPEADSVWSESWSEWLHEAKPGWKPVQPIALAETR